MRNAVIIAVTVLSVGLALAAAIEPRVVRASPGVYVVINPWFGANQVCELDQGPQLPSARLAVFGVRCRTIEGWRAALLVAQKAAARTEDARAAAARRSQAVFNARVESLSRQARDPTWRAKHCVFASAAPVSAPGTRPDPQFQAALADLDPAKDTARWKACAPYRITRRPGEPGTSSAEDAAAPHPREGVGTRTGEALPPR